MHRFVSHHPFLSYLFSTSFKLRLDERDQDLVAFGRQIAANPNNVSDDLFARVQKHFDSNQILSLVAFAGLMVATNIVNNSLRVELDEYLETFRRS